MIRYNGLQTPRQGILFGQCSPLLPKHQHGVPKKVQRLFERFDGESCGRGKTPIISDLTHSWWASVPDPLVGGGQVGGGKASFQGDFFSTLCPFTFCLCVMILIFNFNFDLHIFPSRWCFHRLPPSPGNCCPLSSANMTFCLNMMIFSNKISLTCNFCRLSPDDNL